MAPYFACLPQVCFIRTVCEMVPWGRLATTVAMLGLLHLGISQTPKIGDVDTKHNLHDVSLKRCAVFTHMNKSAGSTIRGMLHKYTFRKNIKMGSFSSQEYEQGAEFTTEFLDEEYDVIAGDYTEGFRRNPEHDVAEDCLWFTMFRQ